MCYQPTRILYLCLGFFDLHTPRLSGRNFNGPNVARDHYDTELKFVTEEIEQLCQTLESRGDYDDSIIIITGDHGDLFREVNQFDGNYIPKTLGTVLESSNYFGTNYHGHLEKPLYDELLHVPLYMKLPGCERGGQRFQGQVELIDILPTILEMTGGTPAESVEGENLLSTLNTGEGKEYVFAEVEPTTSSGRFEIARSQQYKISSHTPPNGIAGKNPALYAFRRWFTKRERFTARIDERSELTREHKEQAGHQRVLEKWRGRERLSVGRENDDPQKLSSEQRKELEALGYL